MSSPKHCLDDTLSNISGNQDAPFVVCILGATGTGKTAAALDLAREFKGEVVNFDSRQIYKGLAVVTAQPGPDETAVCPHHLYGFLDPCRRMMAAACARLARDTAAEIQDRNGLPLLVGGTGLYLRAILHGLDDIPDIDPEVRSRVRARCRESGPQVLHRRLQQVDPEYAARIHPNDTQRNCRAMEVFESTGRPLSSWHGGGGQESAYRCLKIGVHMDLDSLTSRLGRRIDCMVASGAVDEMRRALELCPDRNAPGFSGIGCREIAAFLAGEISFDECRALWLKNTRAYAKRQMTWFRREKDVLWIAWDEIGDRMGMVLERVRQHLSRSG